MKGLILLLITLFFLLNCTTKFKAKSQNISWYQERDGEIKKEIIFKDDHATLNYLVFDDYTGNPNKVIEKCTIVEQLFSSKKINNSIYILKNDSSKEFFPLFEKTLNDTVRCFDLTVINFRSPSKDTIYNELNRRFLIKNGKLDSIETKLVFFYDKVILDWHHYFKRKK